MNSHKPQSLLEWVFAWNQARLIIAGATLLLAKQMPILTYLSIPIISPLASSLMSLAWLISGVVGVYLVYQWNINGRTVFGGNEKKDVVAFWIAAITGIHLGLVPILNNNIGFSLTPDVLSTPVMIVAGLAYFWTAYHLHKRGGATALFSSTADTPITKVVPTADEKTQ